MMIGSYIVSSFVNLRTFPVEIKESTLISCDRGFCVKEKFKGRLPINLIMQTTKSIGKNAPIKVEQTTLNKYFPNIPKLKDHRLLAELERKDALFNYKGYSIRLKRNGTIYIKETHCLICGSRLVKNGYNDRMAILDNGLGKHEFRIQRKRCRRCGEIQPDYSKIVPKYGNYHENYKRRARQHYMEGLMPSQIQRVFKIDFGIEI